MYKDEVVARVTMSCGQMIGFERIHNEILLPFGTKATFKSQEPFLIREWTKSRSVPNGRQGKDRIEAVLGASVSDGFLKSLGVSLTDSYWLKEEDSKLTWVDVNFWDNGFTPVFALALNGVGVFEKSPDFTTDGVMSKYWILSGGFPFLKKTESGQFAKEMVANEVAVSEIAKELCLKHTPYFEGETNGTKTCGCPCYVNGSDEEYVSALQIKHEHIGDAGFSLPSYFDNELGLKKDLDEIRLLDVLTGQRDRHEKNLGVIVTGHDLATARLVPTFDNGSCLCFNRVESKDNLKFFNKRREDVARDIDDLPDIDYKKISRIVQCVYEDFGIDSGQLENALGDLSAGFCILEEIRKERDSERCM